MQDAPASSASTSEGRSSAWRRWTATDGSLTDVASTPTGRAFGPQDLQQGAARPDRPPAPRRSTDAPWPRSASAPRASWARGARSRSRRTCRCSTAWTWRHWCATSAGCPVRLENDARCFTLAEARYGAGRGAQDVCGITLGTGVGCGVMTGGRLHRGHERPGGRGLAHPDARAAPRALPLGRGQWCAPTEAAGGAATPGLDSAEVVSRARAGDAAALRGLARVRRGPGVPVRDDRLPARPGRHRDRRARSRRPAISTARCSSHRWRRTPRAWPTASSAPPPGSSAPPP